MDFALPLPFAAALCGLAAREGGGDRPALAPPLRGLRSALRAGMSLAVGAGLVYGFLVIFAAEPWLYSQNPALFQNASRLVQFWL